LADLPEIGDISLDRGSANELSIAEVRNLSPTQYATLVGDDRVGGRTNLSSTIIQIQYLNMALILFRRIRSRPNMITMSTLD
jgi:hypothetical protein